MNKNELLKIKDSRKNKITDIQNITAKVSDNILCIYIYNNKKLEKTIFIKRNERLTYNYITGKWSGNKVTDDISFINIEDSSKNVIDRFLKKFELTDGKCERALPYASLLNELSSRTFTLNKPNDYELIKDVIANLDKDKIKNQIHNALPAKILVHNKTKCFCTKCKSDFTAPLKARTKTTCPNCKSEANVLPVLPYVKYATKYTDGTVKTYFENRSYRSLVIHTIVKHVNKNNKILLEMPAYPIYNVQYENLDTKPLSECITENIHHYVEKAIVFKPHHLEKIYQVQYYGLQNKSHNYTSIPYNTLNFTSAFTDIYTTFDIENKGDLRKLKGYNNPKYNLNEDLIFKINTLYADTDHFKTISNEIYNILMKSEKNNDFHTLYKHINSNGRNLKEILGLEQLKDDQVKKLSDINTNISNITNKLSAILTSLKQNKFNSQFVDQINMIIQNLPEQKYTGHSTYYTYKITYESNRNYEKTLCKTLLTIQNKFIVNVKDKTLNIIESLSKLNKNRLVEEWLRNPDEVVVHKSTELTKALGITKGQLANIECLDDLLWCIFNYNNKLKYKEDTITTIRHYIKRPDNEFLNLLNVTKMSLLQFANYIPTLRKNCIYFTDYNKYIMNCVDLKKQVTSNTINRPKNIKSAINKVKIENNIINNPILKELKQTTDRAELQQTFDDLKLYEYNDKNYSIITPDKPEDVFYEGIALNHCVANSNIYLKRIYEHESYILFLRKTNDIETPWYTLEVEPGGIIRQKRTKFDNVNKDFEDALPFLKKWQKHINDITKDNLSSEIENSKAKRLENLMTLRSQRKTVIINGKVHLLADILEQDLLQI